MLRRERSRLFASVVLAGAALGGGGGLTGCTSAAPGPSDAADTAPDQPFTDIFAPDSTRDVPFATISTDAPMDHPFSDISAPDVFRDVPPADAVDAQPDIPFSDIFASS